MDENRKQKIQIILNFLKERFPSASFINFRENRRQGHCFKINDHTLDGSVNLLFSDEFLDDRMYKNLSQFFVEEGDFILNQIREGHRTILVTNTGITPEN